MKRAIEVWVDLGEVQPHVCGLDVPLEVIPLELWGSGSAGRTLQFVQQFVFSCSEMGGSFDALFLQVHCGSWRNRGRDLPSPQPCVRKQ